MWKAKGTLPALKSPVLISGLPGIGSVGKIAVDYLTDSLKAQKVLAFETDSMPNSVIVTEDNLIQLPTIELHLKKAKDTTLLLVTGNYQPIDERSCFEFSSMLLSRAKDAGVKDIITLGGIGLAELPADPKVYITGNSKRGIQKFAKGTDLETDIYGVVGPIMGVSGVLAGLASAYGMGAVVLLGETLAHPMYFGIRPAKSILSILSKKFSLKVDLARIDAEIREIEAMLSQNLKPEEMKALKKFSKYSDMNYIG